MYIICIIELKKPNKYMKIQSQLTASKSTKFTTTIVFQQKPKLHKCNF